ncbi:MAG: hypothetical protein U9R08_04245 [Nanoarchaeota archaeon]|nr:hypothetical protein [Nanoarchaeota archaeon]
MRNKLVLLLILGFILFSTLCLAENAYLNLINRDGTIAYTKQKLDLTSGEETEITTNIKDETNNMWSSTEGQWSIAFGVTNMQDVEVGACYTYVDGGCPTGWAVEHPTQCPKEEDLTCTPDNECPVDDPECENQDLDCDCDWNFNDGVISEQTPGGVCIGSCRTAYEAWVDQQLSSQISPNTDITNAHFVNWDQDKDACECYIENHKSINFIEESWLDSIDGVSIDSAGPKCCGDDLTEQNNGRVADQYLCGIGHDVPNEAKWHFAFTSGNQLRIFPYNEHDIIATDEDLLTGVKGVFYACIDNSENELSSIGPEARSFTIDETLPVGGGFEYPVEYGPAYLCTELGDGTRITECCSQGKCLNAVEHRDKIAAIGTSNTYINDGSDSIWQVQGVINENTQGPIIVTSSSEGRYSVPSLRIKNWEAFDTFEFDIKFEAGIYVPPSKLFIYYNNGYNVKSFNLNEYTVPNYWRPDKWNHIIIPLNLISDKEKISSIQISTEPSRTSMIEIDNFMVKNDHTRYCSGQFHTWIEDLDSGNPEALKLTCNQLEGKAWTGSACCGDDPNPAQNAGEFLVGSEKGCWDSIPIDINHTVGLDLLSEETEQYQDIIFTNEEKFKICNASDSSYTGVVINTRPEIFSNTAKNCEIIGDYFCSYQNIWSNEDVKTGIPANTRNASRNIAPGINLLIGFEPNE